ERQSRLAGAGWSPEDRRRQAIVLDETSQRLADGHEVVLADDVGDRPGPQPRGERRGGTQPLLDRGGEQVSHRAPAGTGTDGTRRPSRSARAGRSTSRPRTRCRRGWG